MKNKKAYLIRLSVAAVVFVAVILTACGLTTFAPAVKVQLFPLLNRHGWGVLAAVLILTVLFGRFYCSVVCPFGILQDIIAFLARRKGAPDVNRKKLRYGIAGFAFASFAAGTVLIMGFLDPYSNFGRVVEFFKHPTFWWGGAVFAVIAVLSVWKKRVFCTSICPVGTVLGLFSKIGVFKMGLSDKCVKCGQCAKVCPSGCVDPKAGVLDNERCVRCLKCTAVCPLKCIGFGKKKTKPAKVDFSRRGFLTGTFTTAAAMTAGAALAKNLDYVLPPASERPICPPGAGSPDAFYEKCTNCGLCVSACEGKVLRPRGKGFQTVHLEYGKDYCLYGCTKCNTVCPTGALKPLTLAQKQKSRIGMARFDQNTCVGCGLCARKCPQGAIDIVDGKARLLPQYCIGCGACVATCPVGAASVIAVVVQTEASKGRTE